jgi:hypothetical protein
VAPLKLRLPAHLLGPTRVAVPWTLLGGFDDAVSSPDGRWTLALDRNGLSFVRGPKPARPHRVVPDTQVVMVEWATGAHVARWSTFIERLPQVTDVAGGPAPLAAR